jgi:3-oxoacyl-[acyl-carrier protein] reductase
VSAEQNTSTGQRIAIVTGGSRGIGRGVVEELTTAGYAAVVGYGSNHAEAEQVVAAAEAKGARAVAVAADVADEDAVSRLFDTAETLSVAWTSW